MSKHYLPSSSAAIAGSFEKKTKLEPELVQMSRLKGNFAIGFRHIRAIAKTSGFLVIKSIKLVISVLTYFFRAGARDIESEYALVTSMVLLYLFGAVGFFAIIGKDFGVLLILKTLSPALYFPVTYFLGMFSDSKFARELKSVYLKELTSSGSTKD